MAGTSVDLLFFPIDTVKTRLQSAQGFAKAGGFAGIYKGVGSVIVGSAPGGVYSVSPSPFSPRIHELSYIISRDILRDI